MKFSVRFLFILIIFSSILVFCSSPPKQENTDPVVTAPAQPAEPTAEEKKEAAKTIRAAIKKSDSEFFKNVKLEELSRAFKHEDSKGKKIIEKTGFKVIPALIGGFKNSDAQVRKLIYTELTFPNQKLAEGETLRHEMERNKETQPFFDILKNTIIETDEKDSEAVPAFTELFKKVFTGEKEKDYKPLMKTLRMEKTTVAVKKLIIEELNYSSAGGPATVFPDSKKRNAKADKISKLADKTEDTEIKELLKQLSENYKKEAEKPSP